MSVPKRAKDLMSYGQVMALATCSQNGEPNVASMKHCWWYNDNTMVIGDLFMKTTKTNIRENGRAAFTVWTAAPEGYKFKGAAEYLTSGPEYQFATSELHKQTPERKFKGVVVIHVEDVYDSKPGPTAGQLIIE